MNCWLSLGSVSSMRPRSWAQAFNDLSIAAKLNVGFGVLVFLILIGVGLIFAAGRRATADINMTRDVRAPAALASAQAQASLLDMQANVRGYLALGDLRYIDDYNKAKEHFEENLALLNALSADWTKDDDIQQLNDLKVIFDAWSPIPEQLFELHDDPIANQQALRIESTDFRPASALVLQQIDTLISLQERQFPTPEQSDLLSNMSNVRSSHQAMVTNLRAYAISGDVGFKFGYGENLDANRTAFQQLVEARDLMTGEQQQVLALLQTERSELLRLPQQIFTAIEGERTVEDLYLFRTEAEPLAETMVMLLGQMTIAQQSYLQADLDRSKVGLTRVQYQILLGGLLALALGIGMALFFRRTIADPVKRLEQTAGRIGVGDLDVQAQVSSADEIGSLAQAFNAMTGRLRQTIGSLELLFDMSRGMMAAGDLSELIGVVVQRGDVEAINRAVLNLFEFDAEGEVVGMVVEANWYDDQGTPPSPEGTRYARSVNTIIDLFLAKDPLFFDDMQHDPRIDPETMAVAQRLNIRAAVALPLWVQQQQMGVLLLEGDDAYQFQPQDIEPYLSMLGQLAIAIENRRLFEQTQERALELAAAKEIAEEASRAKSEFLANMSHELRTPLNAILGYAQILARSPDLESAQRKQVEIIYESGSHLLLLINDILDLSKIEASKLELFPSDFSLSRFLDGIIEIFRLRADQTDGPDFQAEYLTSLPAIVHADETRLRQVLMNLLSNALKFTQDGVVAFRVAATETRTTDSDEEAMALMHFQVEDTGIGMTEQELAQIFLPFEQVGDPGLRAKGTGLGLSISRSLVNAMHGTLEVQSTPGKGTIFDVTLMLPVIWSAPQPKTISNLVVSGYEGRRRTVLVVDDEPHNRNLLTSLLGRLGFDVTEAANGAAALALADAHFPDIVLLDLLMPEMDGFEVARRLRQRPAQEAVQMTIIAVSANAFEQQVFEAEQAGCDAFLAKPIDVDRLLSLLQKHAGLTWIIDDGSVSENSQRSQEEGRPAMTPTLITPPPNDLAVLLDLAMKGELPRLMKVVEAHVAEDSVYQPFAKQLRPLVDNFDEEGVWALLKGTSQAK